MSPLDRQILVQLRAAGPAWKRSYQAAKVAVDRLITAKLIEPCAPEGLKARNMIRITEAGRKALEQ
jgi:DNA-binding MarR family transcriptional regulator